MQESMFPFMSVSVAFLAVVASIVAPIDAQAVSKYLKRIAYSEALLASSHKPSITCTDSFLSGE